MDDGLPRAVKITGITKETPRIRTFRLSGSFGFTPGQFVMVWVPGVDEIPMALSGEDTLSVQEVGDATRAMFRLEKGDLLGIRGPFGKGFTPGGKVLAVAGGIGAAPLLPLAMQGRVEVFLQGAATGRELPFRKALSRATDLRVATDDGSEGHHGFVTDLLGDVKLRDFGSVCACGPEPMMLTVLRILDEAGMARKGQFSLHRYMKCGVGVCGSCAIDPDGLRVCREGPVFTGTHLAGTEFGQYTRDASGRRKRVG